MLGLLLLIAIAYAGARGVEKAVGLDGPAACRYSSKEAHATVGRMAKTRFVDVRKPGPIEPGGTFSAAAPRSAALGGRAAVPLAVVTESSATMWKAVVEGYRARWPELREEHRKRMVARAARRKAEREAFLAERKAAEAAAKAGPPPAFPPKPVDPPKTRATDAEPAEPQDAIPAPAPDTADADEAKTTTEPATGRRHLTVVPNPALNGEPMSAVIPEIRTLDGLLNALTVTRAMCEMRAEEAEAVAADDLQLSNRLDQIEAEMAALQVDAKTRAEIDALRESVHAQSKAAAEYGSAAKDAADLALATANAAHKSHGGIAEAVQSSPIEVAAQAGYYKH